MAAEPDQVKSVFLQAVEEFEPGQWGEFLDTACAGDGVLRERVEILLQAHLGKDSVLDDPDEGPSPTLEPCPREGPGTRSDRTNCSRKSVRAAWAWCTWRNRPSPSSGGWR